MQCVVIVQLTCEIVEKRGRERANILPEPRRVEEGVRMLAEVLGQSGMCRNSFLDLHMLMSAEGTVG